MTRSLQVNPTNQKAENMNAISPKFPQRCLLAAAICAALGVIPTASANSLTRASNASIEASLAVPVVLTQGTLQFFKDAGTLSVTGITTVGNVSTVMMQSLVTGATASMEVSGKALGGSVMLATVSVLKPVVSATGVSLMLGESVIMFIPNEIGRALLHHSRARE